jgi:hypothetical protein
MRRTDRGRCRFRIALLAGTVAALLAGPEALAQAQIAAQARATGRAPTVAPPEEVGPWPKVGFETVGSVEYAGMDAKAGTDRPAEIDVRLESTFLVEFNDALSLDGLFQYKSKQPRPLTDPNRELFANQGAGRRNGGRMKELYLRYGDWRVGKFTQDFGHAVDLLPGLYAQDFVEEYEASEMVGVEKIHVYDDESEGWRQLTLAAFKVDQSFLNETFPYNVGRIRRRDGGTGNTRWPENLMVTWDTFNMPVGHWAHMGYQASVIRWGKAHGDQKGQWWSTADFDLSIPLGGSVEDTLRGRYSQLHLFLEGVRQDNFEGFDGRTRHLLSASAEYLYGPWVLDLTTTQRWTRDRLAGRQKDAIYTTTLGYALPSDTVAAVSIAHETADGREGVYAGFRLTQTLTSCSRCLTKGRYY